MRPLNSKERRVKFLLFVLLFVLSTLPLLVLVYQYGKLDVAENDFLRKRYKELQKDQHSVEVDQTKVDNVQRQVSEFQKFLSDRNADMLELKRDYSNTIETSIGGFNLSEVPRLDHADTALIKMVEDLRGSLRLMNSVFASGVELRQEYDKLKEEHSKCAVSSPWDSR